ncbi:MAG: RES family NAD+ phosphorylase, partial [Gammaproteobacteria bacterium]
AGRWDPGLFDVLYTAFERDGAIAEMHFHLSRQPVFPSKIDFTVNEIAVRTANTLKFANLNELKPLGVDVREYTKVLYQRTQEIGDAAAFLGFDGIIAPNARWDCLNLVIFSDQMEPNDLELRQSSIIDFAAWRRARAAS